MNDKIKDVIVIGSGMAGVTAAKAASDELAGVEIITKGAGATMMGSGVLDILGAVPGEEKNIVVEEISEGMTLLLEKNPKHPYAVLKDSLENGIKALLEVCRAGGMEFTGDGIRNAAIPNILGTYKNTAYIPSYNKYADVTTARGKILVAGFRGYTEFYPEYACKSYNAYQKQFAPKADAAYIAVTLELPSLTNREKLTNAELAAFFDTSEGIEELAAVLDDMKNVMGGIQRILVPPVLGYQNYAQNMELLYETLGIPVGEISAGGHSVSAQRLADAFEKGLENLNIKVTNQAKAVEIKKTEEGVFCVVFEQQGKTREAYARKIVLAAGGFIGGGITSYREDVFIPVIHEPLGRIDADMVNKKAFPGGGQPFIKTGIRVYDDMTIAQGSFSGQIFACGDLMEGYDWVYERSGAGVAAASGYLAGKNAANMAKGSEH